MPLLNAANPTADLELSEHEDLYTAIIEGNFDGGQVDIRVKASATSNFVTVPNSTFTTDTAFDFLNSYVDAEARITGGVGSEAVNVTFKQINHREL